MHSWLWLVSVNSQVAMLRVSRKFLYPNIGVWMNKKINGCSAVCHSYQLPAFSGQVMQRRQGYNYNTAAENSKRKTPAPYYFHEPVINIVLPRYRSIIEKYQLIIDNELMASCANFIYRLNTQAILCIIIRK